MYMCVNVGGCRCVGGACVCVCTCTCACQCVCVCVCVQRAASACGVGTGTRESGKDKKGGTQAGSSLGNRDSWFRYT